jgi:hypothetical protein
MDWCVADKFEDANHQPVIQVKGELDRSVNSGQSISLSASKTQDPDGDRLSYRWWQYEEAGSYEGSLDLQNSENANLKFIAPQVSKQETIHIILSVSDDGSPSLTSYKRFILTVSP